MKTKIQTLFIALVWLALPMLVQAQFTFTTNNGAITITGYNPAAGLNAVIPAATNGYPVTSIGDSAFEECKSLTSVTLPNSVTSIGDSAFNECTGLTSVTILNGVTSIGTREFAGCTGLTSVTIPNSVTNIGDSAFYYCIGLTSVTILNGVTTIGVGAFSYSGLTSVTIPSSVISIENYAFEDCISLTSVTIPNSVTSIGNVVFYGCTSLTSVTLSASVTSIGYYAFAGCYSLRSAYFLGNAPPDDGTAFGGNPYSDPTTVYYLAGTTGWGSFFGGVHAVLWNPQANTFGFTGGQFGFNLTGPAYAVIVVEACTSLSHPVWLPVSTNTLSGLGTSVFSDPTGYPMRYYVSGRLDVKKQESCTPAQSSSARPENLIVVAD